MNTIKNVVTLGGGGGHAQVLKGLKALPDIAITAICPSTDSGGSTGIFVRDYGCLGYLGDLTKCVAALCPDERLSRALMQRFEGGCLHGHSLKNLLLLGLTQATGLSGSEALALFHRMCRIDRHRVIPASFEHAELCARLKFGSEIVGETNIDNLAKNPIWSPDVHAIKSLYLRPSVSASKDAVDVISRADQCIICPGDLYSSVIPTLLPTGIKAAFRRSKTRVIMILNIMTKQGETDGYSAEDLVKRIEESIGRRCDIIIVNSASIPKRSLLLYRLEQKISVSSRTLLRDRRLMKAPLVNVAPSGRLYHDPVAIRKTLEKVFNENSKGKRGN